MFGLYVSPIPSDRPAQRGIAGSVDDASLQALALHRPEATQRVGSIQFDPAIFGSAVALRQPQAVSGGREAQLEEKVEDLERQLEESRRQLAETQILLAETRGRLAESRDVRQESASQLKKPSRRPEAQQRKSDVGRQQHRSQSQQVNEKLEQRPKEELEMVSRYARLLTVLADDPDPRECLLFLARIQRPLSRPLLHFPEWSVVYPLPATVTGVIHATYHDQYIYAVLASAGEEHIYRLPAQDLTTGRWEDVKVPAAGPAKYHGFISHAGSLYILYAATNVAKYSLYKRVDGNWVLITQLREREYFAFGVANSKLFIVGGGIRNCPIIGAASFSLAEENAAWVSLPDLPVHCINGHFVCFGTKVCVIGRQHLPSEVMQEHVLSIDATAGPDSHSWSQMSLPRIDYVYSSACRLHSTVAIAGGLDYRGSTYGPSCTTASCILDKDTNRWAPLPPLKVQRAIPHLLFDDDRNRLICFGGISDPSGTFCNTMEVLQL